MPSLDDLKKRIGSVKSTQKITKAMKMVAAAKLRRAQESAESSRPYSDSMKDLIESISKGWRICILKSSSMTDGAWLLKTW